MINLSSIKWAVIMSMIVVTGTLTSEGVECQAMRADDGTLYTLTGELGAYAPGDRVRVEGEPAMFSKCMQGQTLNVKRIGLAGDKN